MTGGKCQLRSGGAGARARAPAGDGGDSASGLAATESAAGVGGAAHAAFFQLRGAEKLVRARSLRPPRRAGPALVADLEGSARRDRRRQRCFAHPGVVEAALGYYRAVAASTARALQPLAMPGVAFCGTEDSVLTRTTTSGPAASTAAATRSSPCPAATFCTANIPSASTMSSCASRDRWRADRAGKRNDGSAGRLGTIALLKGGE